MAKCARDRFIGPSVVRPDGLSASGFQVDPAFTTLVISSYVSSPDVYTSLRIRKSARMTQFRSISPAAVVFVFVDIYIYIHNGSDGRNGNKARYIDGEYVFLL